MTPTADDASLTNVPVPDPTQLTMDALQREITTIHRELEMRQVMREREHAALEKITETRLDAMDKATDLLSETVNRTPTEITKEITHLRGILDERLTSVDMRFLDADRLTSTQFKERDTRTEREARDNKLAVDAAFAAQEKQAVAQNEGNQLAIDKSEQSTAETINALRKSAEDREQRQREVDEDMKRRLGSIEASLVGISVGKQTTADTKGDSRANSNLILTLIGTFLVALSLGVGVASLFLRP